MFFERSIWRQPYRHDPTQKASSLAPGSAATFYSVASNVTGGAPRGTSSASQVLGFPTAESGVATPALTISSPNTVDRYGLVATDAAGNIYVFSSNTAQECGEVPGSAKILVFAPATGGTLTANPIGTITGPAAQLDGAGLMAVDGLGNIYLWETAGGGSTVPDILVQFAAGARLPTISRCTGDHSRRWHAPRGSDAYAKRSISSGTVLWCLCRMGRALNPNGMSC